VGQLLPPPLQLHRSDHTERGTKGVGTKAGLTSVQGILEQITLNLEVGGMPGLDSEDERAKKTPEAAGGDSASEKHSETADGAAQRVGNKQDFSLQRVMLTLGSGSVAGVVAKTATAPFTRVKLLFQVTENRFSVASAWAMASGLIRQLFLHAIS
jgi:hypothetical protein